MNKLTSSFRDNSGYVFKKDNEIYRSINPIYKDNYELLMQSGLYQELVNKKYLVSHQEIDTTKDGAYKIIKPEMIDFITYPYEWSFSMFKDAALLTLKIQMIALKYGMVLKDATAYNVQFKNGKPIFIDTLSFEKYEEGYIWKPYKQFCQHFLAPLLLMSYTDLRLNQLLITNIDGIPLNLVKKLLPKTALLNPFIFMNIVVQSGMQKQYEKKDINFGDKKCVKKQQLIDMNKQMQDFINGLKFPSSDTEWGEYYTFTNYDDKAEMAKKDIVEKFINNINPKSLWDLGANNGLFTRIASTKGINSIAFDIDPVACEKNYNQIKQSKENNLLPVLFDLTNPSPSIGWANAERDSIFRRTKPDVIMALAIIHHISISNNVPLENVAQMLSSLSDNLIIEFVPKEDSKVQKLLATREDIFDKYTEQGFEEAFTQYYCIEEKVKIENSLRTLYRMRSKK